MAHETYMKRQRETPTHEILEPGHPLCLIAKGTLERVIWGQKMFSNLPIGAALIYAYVQDDQWLTAKELADLGEISEDTARRTLRPLVAAGRVLSRVDGRPTRYRLSRELGERSIEKLLTVPKC